ncbi:MAG: type I secretion system permease/ATPase [Geminicoccaceae bacterium]
MAAEPAKTPGRIVLEATRSPLLLAGLVSGAIGLLMLSVPMFSLQIYDRVLGSGSRETLLALSLVAGTALSVLGVLESIRGAVLARMSTRLGSRLAGPLLAAGAQAGDPGQGLRDLSQLRQTLSGPALMALFDAPWLPAALILVWIMHPMLGLFGLVSALTLITLAFLGELAARRRMQAANRLTPLAQRQVDALGRQREVIAAMGLLPALQHRFTGFHDRALVLQQEAQERAGRVSGVARAARLLIQAGVLALGALLVIDGDLTGGGMIASSILLSRALAPVEQMLAGWRSLVAGRESWQRLRDLLAQAPAGLRALPMPPPQGRLALEQVSVTVGERTLLQPISFTLEAGQILGVVGSSGAGKTTLCRLILGVMPPSGGVVRLDGVDIATQSRATLGPHIGYLPQNPSLFAGTVAENIARLAAEPEGEAVVAAAKAAGVHELILRLPKGYDTVLGEEGAPLSAGQRQRLGLARALYGAPSLVVLDEPNAHLDAEGEQTLAMALLGLKQRGATVLLVTHRLAILRHADQVLVLEHGAIERLGPREPVLAALVRPTRAA